MKSRILFRTVLFCILIGFMLSFSPKASADLPSGLVAYYPFNGNVNDESGNGHDGTLYGSTLTADRMGNPNSAYYFNGTATDYIDVGPLSISLPVTVTLWFNSTTRNDEWNTLFGWNRPIHPNNGIQIVANGDGKIKSFIGGDPAMISNSVIDGDGKWHCVVINRNLNNEKKLYIDGILEVSGTDTASIGTTHDLYIGRSFQPNEYNEHFLGIIDDVRIYSRVLSEAEIQDLVYDQDRDGVPDDSDTCPEMANGPNLGTCINCRNGNVGQTCTSNDECGDSGVCSLNQERICSDFDGDQVINEEDNCICIDNPDQVDTDSDGIGNVCDNCPNDPNPDQADADGDGTGDICEKNAPCPVLSIYGNHSEETEVLRYFRGKVLSQTQEGQELINLYYQWSPVIVEAMEKDEVFKEAMKELIDSILPIIEKVIK